MSQSSQTRVFTEADAVTLWLWTAWMIFGLLVAIGAMVVLVVGVFYDQWTTIRAQSGLALIGGLFVFFWGLNNTFGRD